MQILSLISGILLKINECIINKNVKMNKYFFVLSWLAFLI